MLSPLFPIFTIYFIILWELCKFQKNKKSPGRNSHHGPSPLPYSCLRASFPISECKFISLQKHPKKNFFLPLFAMFYEQFGACTRCSCSWFISHYILRLVLKQLFLLYTFVLFSPVYAPLQARAPRSAVADKKHAVHSSSFWRISA